MSHHRHRHRAPRSAADVPSARRRPHAGAGRPARRSSPSSPSVWLFPLGWALFNSFRDYAYTSANGYVSFGGFTLDNYANAWKQGDFGPNFVNSLIITVPAVVLTLLLASCVAFVLARFSFRFNLTLLGFFLAANLLPPQALLVPVFRIFRLIPIPGGLIGSDTLLNSHSG